MTSTPHSPQTDINQTDINQTDINQTDIKVAFFGSPAFAVPVLEAIRANFELVLVVAQPDKPVGRGLKMQAPPVAAWATQQGIPLLQPERLRGNREFRQHLRASGANVAVTCAYGKLLPKRLLEVPRFGFLNTHTSLLPLYRGAAPIQRAMMSGDQQTGTTIMQTDVGMDTGDIVLQEALDILPDWTVQDLAEALSAQASRLIVQALAQVDTLPRIPQDHSRATHADMLSKEEGEINWTQPLFVLYNRYRGLYGWPGSYTFYAGKRLKVLALKPTNLHSDLAAGTLLEATTDGVLVVCGAGEVVCLSEVQPESKPALAAAAWFKNYQIPAGVRLG